MQTTTDNGLWEISMKRPIRHFRHLPWALSGLAILMAFSGCGTYKAVEKSTKKMVREFWTNGDAPKKTLVITAFENRSGLTLAHFSDTFAARIAELIGQDCPGVRVITPASKDFPADLTTLPGDAQGKIAHLDLARIGRSLGINQIMVGRLVSVLVTEKRHGMLWWKSVQPWIKIHIAVSVYSTETGAKILDDDYHQERQVEDVDVSVIRAGNSQVPALEEGLQVLSAHIAEAVCDAVSSQPWKGYVIGKTGDTVQISSGSAVGLKQDMVLDVFDSGQVIQAAAGTYFLPGIRIGTLRITQVQENRSDATVVEGQGIKAECSVRVHR
jgi:hypothetical protein